MTAPGLYLSLSRDAYEAIPAPHYSKLKHLRRSPAHARHALLHPEPPTAALEIGSAVHLAVLERERFDQEYHAAPICDRRTKEGKAIWAETEERAAGRTILRADEYEMCCALAAAVWRHPVAAEILKSAGHNEASLVWEQDGGIIKARVDSLRLVAGWPAVIDLKTTLDASPQGFAREVARRDYHVQGGLYTLGMERLFESAHKYLWIAVEKAAPWAVAVYELAHDDLMLGREIGLRWLAQWRACEASGIWAGYSDEIRTLALPSWALVPPTDEQDGTNVFA
jgi:hypothetical protein